MSVLTSHLFRTAHRNTFPLLTPLWNSTLESLVIHQDGTQICGSASDADFVIALEGVAPRHCVLILRNGRLTVKKGDGAIWVNEIPVHSDTLLQEHDVLSIGPASFRLELADRTESRPLRATHFDPPGGENVPSEFLSATSAGSDFEEGGLPLRAAESLLSTTAVPSPDSDTRLRQNLQVLKSREDRLDRQADQLRDRELSIHDRERKLDQLETEVASQQRRLASQQQAVEHERAELQHRESLLNQEQQAMQQRRHEFEQLRFAATQQQDQQQQEYQQLFDQLNRSQRTLLAREQSLNSMQAALAAREQSISENEDRLQRHLDELARQETSLSEHAASLEQRSRDIEGLKTLLLQDQSQLQCELTDVRAANAAANSELSLQRDLLQHLQERLAAEQRDLDSSWASLQQQQRSLASQETVISERQAELSERADELAARIVKLKSVRSTLRLREHLTREEAAVTQASVVPAAVMSEADAAQLAKAELAKAELAKAELAKFAAESADREQELQTQLDVLQSERAALLTALQELQSRFEILRRDLEHTDLLKDEILSLQKSVAEKDATIAVQQQGMAELQAAALLPIPEEDRATADTKDNAEAARVEEQLLQELSQLRNDLQDNLTARRESESLFDTRLRERQEEVRQLSARLNERDDLIRQLREQLQLAASQHQARDSQRGSEELQVLSRELDQRAAVLDRRDDELRDMARRLELANEEVEQQRRQMLEARQQLELARAELQMAMPIVSDRHSHSPDASDSLAPTPLESPLRQTGDAPHRSGHQRTASAPVSSSRDDHDSKRETGKLRSELASLFGLQTTKEQPSDLFLDTSEPAASISQTGVELSFSAEIPLLIEAGPALESSTTAVAADDAPDFVKDYMEGLLARSRKAAGSSLPTELRQNQPGASSRSVAGDQRKSAAPEQRTKQNKSFIDHYMSVGIEGLEGMPGDSDNREPFPTSVATEEPSPRANTAPRARIDRDKLRENMDSFRTVSAQSVENALTSAAVRKERNSIIGRIALVITMVLTSVFQGIALMLGIVEEPIFMWATIFATVASTLELAKKFYDIRHQFRGTIAQARRSSGAELAETRTRSTAPVEPPISDVTEASGGSAAIVQPILTETTDSASVLSVTIEDDPGKFTPEECSEEKERLPRQSTPRPSEGMPDGDRFFEM